MINLCTDYMINLYNYLLNYSTTVAIFIFSSGRGKKFARNLHKFPFILIQKRDVENDHRFSSIILYEEKLQFWSRLLHVLPVATKCSNVIKWGKLRSGSPQVLDIVGYF